MHYIIIFIKDPCLKMMAAPQFLQTFLLIWIYLQRTSECWTGLVFKWLKPVGLLNGPVFKRLLNTEINLDWYSPGLPNCLTSVIWNQDKKVFEILNIQILGVRFPDVPARSFLLLYKKNSHQKNLAAAAFCFIFRFLF
jgi:hypothetical protein